MIGPPRDLVELFARKAQARSRFDAMSHIEKMELAARLYRDRLELAGGSPPSSYPIPARQDTNFRWSLDESGMNRAQATVLMMQRPMRLFDVEDYTLYEIQKDCGLFFLLTSDKQIEFAMSYRPIALSGLSESVVEAQIWRSDFCRVSGIGDRILCDELVPRFGCVASAAPLAHRGDEYWIDRIVHAHAHRDLDVGTYDGTVAASGVDIRAFLRQRDLGRTRKTPFPDRFFIRQRASGEAKA